ncbi:MAG TPA: hypothetical protein DGD08_17300 [Gemmatimonas aurantiaca]|uniref:Uncharacterized protein n=2 Tax=Gemmatimonas aurantiaca TaxID=173480 RepID=C1AEL6_GEMAT|nr:hypothetical protein [Gemmatimonas aurantiaca]BAH40943.1 hypothetical protein GAU_3901 [Gemmatimonas aurantiaca T-27]HCT58960.1 hypothetical protein [Gemmatimonas aurantiaca]
MHAVRTCIVATVATVTVASLSARRMDAQSTRGGPLLWVDLGGARVQQPLSAERSAASMGGGIWQRFGALGIGGDAAMTFADDSAAAAQWVLRTSLAPSWLRWSRTDVDVSATTIGLVMPGHNGNRSFHARQLVQLGPIGLHGGGGGGRTSRMALNSKGHAYVGGLTADVGGLRAGVSLQRSYTNDFQLMEASKIFLSHQAMRYALRDVTGDVSWRSSRLLLAGSIGRRKGLQETRGTARSYLVSAGWQFTSSVMMFAQVGEQMADVVRGVPQARYAGGAIRWTPRLGRTSTSLATSSAVPELRGPEVLLTRGEQGGTIELRINAANDAVVEVMSSISAWAVTRVSRQGEAFVYRLTLPSGSHRIAVRINGGAWRAPLGLASVEDDFGTGAGLVVVP